MRLIVIRLLLIAGLCMSLAAGVRPDAGEGEGKQVAIVIDDFGNGMTGTSDMLKLPVALTVAVMPFLPTTAQDAELAHKLGHEVLLHLPMEPVSGKKEWLGPGAITTNLDDAEIRKRVEAAIDNVPHAVGINNHMGSKATADRRVMRVVLGVCRKRGLFFLDSRTTYKSVVREIAEELGVPYAANDLFLDDRYAAAHIMRQVNLLREHLETHRTGVAIGHVGPPGLLTAQALKNAIPTLRKEAAFVGISAMIQPQIPNVLGRQAESP